MQCASQPDSQATVKKNKNKKNRIVFYLERNLIIY